jgi:hypothetical protein
MKIRTAMVAAVIVLGPSLAFAQQNDIQRGARDGARAGGDAAGPIGAVVGGTVGAAVGTAVAIPDAVISSVRSERAPSVVVQGPVEVDAVLPPDVELRPVPQYTEYRYAVVNDRRVLVDPRSRRVIRVIE